MKSPSTSALPLQPGLAACRLCGVLQRVAAAPAGSAIDCVECGNRLRWHRPHTRRHSSWLAFAGLVLLVPAVGFPVVSVEYLGNFNQFSVAQLIARLYQADHYFIGSFMLLITVVAPAVQCVGLTLLGLSGRGRGSEGCRRARLFLQRGVEAADSWNMSQIFLLALAVAIIQFSNLAALHIGPGGLALPLMVALSRAAATAYDPASDWESWHRE